MKKLLLLLSAALTALAVSACGASAPAAQPAPQNTAAADGHKAVLVIDGSRLPVTLRNGKRLAAIPLRAICAFISRGAI